MTDFFSNLSEKKITHLYQVILTTPVLVGTKKLELKDNEGFYLYKQT